MEQVLVFADKVQPGSREQAEAALAQFEPQAGFSLKTDLLGAARRRMELLHLRQRGGSIDGSRNRDHRQRARS